MSLAARPADIATRYLDGPSGRLAYLDFVPSSGGGGAPVVCVPGYTGSKEDFALLGPFVVAAGRRLLALDLPGQYESDGSSDPLDYTLGALAPSVAALLDFVAEPVHLLGHSLGGLVCRTLVLEPAFGAASTIRSLTLMSSGPSALTGPRVDRLVALEPLLDAGGQQLLYQAMAALAAADTSRAPLPPELQAFLERRFLSSTEAGLRGMALVLRSAPDRVDELRAVGLPMLVTHGAGDDAWAPAIQRDMAERLGAAYAEIPGALHSPAAERPAETAEVLLDYWATLET